MAKGLTAIGTDTTDAEDVAASGLYLRGRAEQAPPLRPKFNSGAAPNLNATALPLERPGKLAGPGTRGTSLELLLRGFGSGAVAELPECVENFFAVELNLAHAEAEDLAEFG